MKKYINKDYIKQFHFAVCRQLSCIMLFQRVVS